MTDIEVALINIGEIAARDIAREEKPQGLKENMKVAKRGGGVAKGARDLYEKETKKSALSKLNSLNYQYVDEKLLEDKKQQNFISFNYVEFDGLKRVLYC